MRKRLILLMMAVAFAACGKEAEKKKTTAQKAPPRPPVESEIADLVPADAAFVVRVASMDKMQGVLERLAKLGGGQGPTDPMAQIGMMTGLTQDQVDRARPFAVAGPLGGMMPPMTFILPVDDPEGIAKGFQRGGSATSGGFAALSMAPAYKAGGSRLVKDMPAADVAVRLDLAKIVAQFRPMIDQSLQMARGMGTMGAGMQMPGVDVNKLFDGIFGWVDDLLDSADTLDLLVSEKAGLYEIDVAYMAREGSPLAKAPASSSGLAELARHVPEDFPIVALMRIDVAKWSEFGFSVAEAMLANIPAEQQQAMRDSIAAGREMIKGLGNEWLFAGEFNADGMRLVCGGRVKDAVTWLDKYQDLVQTPALEGMGMTFTDEGEREENGYKVRRLGIAVDMDKYMQAAGLDKMPPEAAKGARAGMELMFGGGGITMEMAAKGDRLVAVLDRKGGLLAATLGSDSAPAAVQSALGGIRGEPCLLVHVEMHALMQGIADAARKIDPGGKAPVIGPGGPLPLTITGSRDGRTYRGGLTVRLEEMIKFFKRLEEAK